MTVDPARVRLTARSHGAGCACKLGLSELTGVLDTLDFPDHPDLLVGVGVGDDAAVWRRTDGRATIATTDFFTPLVDDPATWGRVAAANAVSDVYAMGGTPRFALNLVGWPRDLPAQLLREVLAGAAEIAAAAGYVIAGGHSIDSAEPLYGQVVIGDADPAQLLTNAGAEVGDHLVLTKPLGTGIVTTALKRSEPHELDGETPLARAYTAAVASMTRLNADASHAAHEHQAHAATDVTGFGLLGHAHRLARASGVACRIEPDAVPLLPEVATLQAAGFVPGGTRRNVEDAAGYLDAPPSRLLAERLCDAQTSGGLLLSVPAAQVDGLLAALDRTGHTAARIGEVVDGDAGRVALAGSST